MYTHAPFDPNQASDTQAFIKKPAADLAESFENLQSNLAILHNLNSQANQDLLNKLGKDYAGIASLGSDFNAAISHINTAQLSEDSKTLVMHVTTSLNGYADTMARLNPESQNAITLDQAKNGVFTPGSIENLGKQFSTAMKLNMSISDLNANIVSINKTYINLLKLGSQSPSTLVGMNGLAPQLMNIDSVATDQLRTLSDLDGTISNLNKGYKTLEDNGGASAAFNPNGAGANNALAAVNDTLQNATTQLSENNMQMKMALGENSAPQTPPVSTPYNKFIPTPSENSE